MVKHDKKIFKPYREDPLWDRSWLQILKRNGPWSALSKCLQCLLHPLTGQKRVRCKLPASDQQHGTSPCCWMHRSLSVCRCSHAGALSHTGCDGSDRWTPEPNYPTEQRYNIESVESVQIDWYKSTKKNFTVLVLHEAMFYTNLISIKALSSE